MNAAFSMCLTLPGIAILAMRQFAKQYSRKIRSLQSGENRISFSREPANAPSPISSTLDGIETVLTPLAVNQPSPIN